MADPNTVPIPSEEIKISPLINKNSNPDTRTNPLVLNKGFVKLLRPSVTLPPGFHTPPLPVKQAFLLKQPDGTAGTPELHIYQDLQNKFPMTMFMLGPPNPNAKSYQDYPQKQTADQSTTMIQKDQMTHTLSDDLISDVSELNSSERFKKLTSIFLLPMFEVHNTMQAMKQNLIKTPSEIHESKPEGLILPRRAQTLAGVTRTHVEDMKRELTPKQHEYFSKMNAFRGSYLSNVLNRREIYFQYVTMSKADMWYLGTQDYEKRYIEMMSQRPKFAQNKSKYAGKKTLVLDLDETLIIATALELTTYDSIVKYVEEGNEMKVYVKFRPFLKEFLEDMSEFYELIIYTSAEQDYADKILETMPFVKDIFAYRLYCPQCIVKESQYLFKMLDLLTENRDLKDLIIVDNTVRNYCLFVRNGIPITDYKGSNTDYQLVYLARYLRELAQQEDIRISIKNDFASFLLDHYKST